MKRLINKIKNINSNSGSSIVLVIVALGFIGILTGALLTAVGYAYRLKLYDYNAKSNFHYLEQGMDEIYAGIGRKTLANLQEAYEETREEVIYYDIASNTYKNLPDDEANELFKTKFMEKVSDVDYLKVWKTIDPGYSDENYKKSIVYDIENMVTNSSIQLEKDDLKLEFMYYNPATKKVEKKDTLVTSNYKNLTKIVLRNVRLSRESEYSRSTAKGKFKQTIQTDIEIARPDFEVAFGNLNADTSTLFSYCMIADSGVDIDWTAQNVLTINGNIYAANDFYNKDYNNYDGNHNGNTNYSDAPEWNRGKDSEGNDVKIEYPMNVVSKYSYVKDTGTHNLYNTGTSLVGTGSATSHPYDGKDLNSKYSGFYVNGGNVNVLADTMVVPGSIAVMNGGKLSVYGINGSGVDSTDVWADEIVLGGYSLPALNNKQEGASALFNADLYVKDDTQVEADYANLKLTGGYYGFSYSGKADDRSYTPIVAKNKSTDKANIYQEMVPELNDDGSIKTDKNGNIIYKDDPENRGHYNSSSIIVNGQYSTLDFSTTKTLFIAGRSYIELSNNKVSNTKKSVDESKIKSAVPDEDKKDVKYTDYTYQYETKLDDYKTGESLSKKSSQLAYYPQKAGGGFTADKKYYQLSSGSKLLNMNLFTKYFKGGKIPIEYHEVVLNEGTSQEKTKTYYYFDFETAVKEKTYNNTIVKFPATIDDDDVPEYAEKLKQMFIKDYFDYFDYCVNKDSDHKLMYMGYEENYDSPANSAATPFPQAQFKLQNPDVDDYILEPLGEDARSANPTTRQAALASVRETITDRVNELQNVTNYQDFITGQIAVANVLKTVDNQGNIHDSASTVNKAYTSGGVTFSDTAIKTITNPKNVTFSMRVNNDSEIESNLLGATGGTNDNKTDTVANATKFADDYNKHYNYYKWALKDINTDTNKGTANPMTEADFIDSLVEKYGEGGITPINYYMNFDQLDVAINGTKNISPSNLDLGEYEVYASDGDITLNGDASKDKEITGIVITKGDVFIKDVKKFNGLIICGGKIYIDRADTDITSINSSILCRNVINECINKASDYKSTDTDKKNQAAQAVKFLKLFKAYEDIAKEAEAGNLEKNSSKKTITNIDYSDVIRYNNWMRNVD